MVSSNNFLTNLKHSSFLVLLLCAVVISAISKPAYAQIGQFKILASDGEADDLFGFSVSIDSIYAIVGARQDDDNGFSSGSAYIFKRSGTSWAQEAKLLPTDGAEIDQFGFSVAISGDYAVVAAPLNNDNGSGSGSAYIFKRSGASWAQEAKLLASDGEFGDQFGYSVAISGDYAVVAVLGDDDNGRDAGSAYIFKRTDTTWTQQTKLLASDGAIGDQFGISVSISGDYAVVGANQDDDNGSGSGSAYIFKRTDTTWTQQAKLLPSDGAAIDRFGWSVAISGYYAAIGAHLDDDNGSGSGSAYIFKRTGASWAEEAKLLASDGALSDEFGTSVAISGDYTVVGADLDHDNGILTGSSYIFKRTDTTWTQQTKLLPSDGAAGDHFGRSIAIDNSYIIVGAWGDDDNGDASGSAYVYLINSAPVITSSATPSGTEDVVFSYTATAIDAEGNSLTFTFSNLSTWLSAEGDSVFGTPTEGVTAGAFSVIVSDGTLKDTLDVTITVAAVNDAPLLSDLPDVIFNEDEKAVVHFSEWFGLVDDPDNADSTLQWSFNSSGGDSVSFIIQGDSVIFEAPQDWFAFNRDTLKVRVSDGSLSDSTRLAVHIMPVNDAPMFVDFPDTVEIVLGESDTLILSEFGFDIDDPDTLLIWSTFDCIGADSIACVTMSADTAFIQTIGDLTGFQELTFLVTDTSGTSDTASVIIYVKAPVGIAGDGLIPLEYTLSNNYPNPFNPQTSISYGLPQQSNLSLIIYNLMGQEIMRWDEQNSQAGFYQKIWNGRNKFGVPVGSGVYFYRIIAGDFVQTRKMVLLK